MAYLHGYTPLEAARLRAQARHLAPWVFSGRPLAGCQSILEVGSGVGGQTALLAETYPDAKITAIERETTSHESALAWLADHPAYSERITSLCADALQIPDELGRHDGAFICWVLEHADAPLELLKNIRFFLQPNARVLVHEVFGQSFFVAPQMPPAVEEYYAAYVEGQRRLGGHPDIGVELGQLLHLAGYHEIHTSALLIQLDDRTPEKRIEIFDYMGPLLRSAEPELLNLGLVKPGLAEQVEVDLRRAGRTQGTVFHYTIIRGEARV